MTYPRAKMIIWNPEAYNKAQVREAAIFILGSFAPAQEDLDQAANLI